MSSPGSEDGEWVAIKKKKKKRRKEPQKRKKKQPKTKRSNCDGWIMRNWFSVRTTWNVRGDARFGAGRSWLVAARLCCCSQRRTKKKKKEKGTRNTKKKKRKWWSGRIHFESLTRPVVPCFVISHWYRNRRCRSIRIFSAADPEKNKTKKLKKTKQNKTKDDHENQIEIEWRNGKSLFSTEPNYYFF